MNKIKIFLSVAILSMAVAGAFATKNTKWNKQSFYYVFNPAGSGSCILVNQTSPAECSSQGLGCTDPSGFQIYLARTNSTTCASPIKQPE